MTKKRNRKKARDESDQQAEQPLVTAEPNGSTDPQRRPLPVTIVPGMRVVDMTTETAGTIVGITETYCIYRFAESDSLGVANWRDIALANVCPAEPLLPADVAENDRRNGRATVLRELLAIGPELSPTEQTLRVELVCHLPLRSKSYGAMCCSRSLHQRIR